ncbi:MAG: cell division protein ZipA [Chiayiivirga sp.]|jgi:cell division protein ZipA|uniref:Cell division protein ZipA n=1 Tax=Denitratimonas tolerans TaxID=1338420 RepID=A0AAW9QYM4_9GAMM|nr:cell division protein ZipA [Xanthomonadaceae bacterium]MDX9764749.1 cell division protein ZipA [Chiayiivirga sp.]
MNWNPDIGIPLAIAGVLLLIGIAIFGRPRKPDQGRRRELEDTPRSAGKRREPELGGDADGDGEFHLGNLDGLDDAAGTTQEELDLIARSLSDDDGGAPDPASAASRIGRRGDAVPEQIITLFVAARGDELIDGASIVVAAEKAGLLYGDMGIFHRLADGKPTSEPVFSVANLVKPGHFDLRHVHDIETPGLTFFMTLPGPVSALDAWETMLPTAQRMAELLDAVVLDEERNALGRQRVAHIRDELRRFDRARERESRRFW